MGCGRVTLAPLRYVHRFTDRHGHVRLYFRRPGHARKPLRGPLGSAEFLADYQAALAAGQPRQPRQPPPGSIDALCTSYLRSTAFAGLGASTQAVYRRIIGAFRARFGTLGAATVERHHIARMIEARAATPAAANHLLRTLRALMRHAVAEGLRRDDPTQGIARAKEKAIGAATWTEADIAAFEARHPTGTRARLALALLLYTGQRRGDVVRLGRHSARDGRLWLRQQKTAAELLLPIHPALAAELAHVPPARLLFLTTEAGAGFTAGGFYNAFSGWCAEAGLPPGRSPHGLRKACARRLAEAGATAHQICAVLGWRRLAQAEVYTRAADQARMAADAMARIGGA
jgi:integrase